MEEGEKSFGPYRLAGPYGPLWRGHETVPLTAKPVAVLWELVTRAGQVVTKEKLLAAVWGETVVSEEVLTTGIRTLRRALGDDPHEPRYIATVHRVGYRFLPAVTTLFAVPRSTVHVPSSPPSPSENSSSTTLAFYQSGTWNEKPGTFLVGRESELAHLHHLFMKALQGERQVVFLTGEPGIGKTTLVRAFLAQVPATDGVVIARGQCVEHYGAGEPYLPVLEALGRLGRSPGHQRLVHLLRQYAPTWLAQLPALVEETELDALLRKVQGSTSQRMLREFAEVIEVGTTETPLILVLEDLHWSDSATVNLVAMLAARSEPARLLVIATYRPVDVIVREHPLRAVIQELHSRGACQEIALSGLDPAAVETYLQRRFPHSFLPLPFVYLLQERTEGNPLFLTNLVNDLVTHGQLARGQEGWELHNEVETIRRSVPENIRSLIQKQIERLSPDLQRLLEGASVVGATFAAATLAPALDTSVEAIEERCEALTQHQFLHRVGLAEWPDGTCTSRYAFQHAIYQMVLQERIVPHRLQRLHQQMGERLEAGYASQADEIAVELAVHFEAGRDILRAVRYRQYAAKNALQKSAHQEAIAHAHAGFALLETLPLSPQRLRQELPFQLVLGPALLATQGYVAPAVERTYTRTLELCEQLGDDPQYFPGLYGLWAYYLVREELQTARNLAEQLLAHAKNRHDPVLLIEAHWALGCTLFWLGELLAARNHLEHSLGLYTREEHGALTLTYGQDPAVSSLCYLAFTLWHLGYPAQALQKGREAIRLADTLAFSYNRVFALGLTSMLHQLRRETPTAKRQAEEASTVSRENAFPFWEAVGVIMSGWTLTESEDKQDGIAQMTKGLTAYQAIGSRIGQTWHRALMAEAYSKAGRLGEGLRLLEDGLDHLRTAGGGNYEAEVHRLKGEILLRKAGSKSFKRRLTRS